MNNEINANTTSIKKYYSLFRLTFILGRLLLIIPVFIKTLFPVFLGFAFWVFYGVFYDANASIFKYYISTAIIINVIAMIIRFIKNMPIGLFDSFSPTDGFHNTIIGDIPEMGTPGESTTIYYPSRYGIQAFVWNKFSADASLQLFKIALFGVGYFVADSVCLLLQIIAVIFSAQRYSELVVILTQANGEPKKGDEIASIAHMNEIKCKEMLLDMKNFDWVIVSQRGFKMNTVMLKTFNPEYKETPIIMSNFSAVNQSESSILNKSYEEQMHEKESRRLAEQQRLTEKFFSMTEKVD